MERCADWNFIKLGNNRWMWRHTPEEPEAMSKKSSSSFPTLEACLANAMAHGFESEISVAHIHGPLALEDMSAVSKLINR